MTMRLGIIVLLVLGSLGVASVATAETVYLEKEQLTLDLPEGWKLVPLSSDARVSVFTVEGQGLTVEMSVFHRSEGPASQATKKETINMVRQLLTVEKRMGFAPRGLDRIGLVGCTGKSYGYKDGDFEVRLATCIPETGERAYVWRMMVESEDEKKRDAAIQVFHALLTERTALGAGEKPKSAAAPSAPGGAAPAGPDGQPSPKGPADAKPPAGEGQPAPPGNTEKKPEKAPAP